MSFLGFLNCFTTPGTLHVLTNNNYTQELQSTELKSLFCFGASLCKSLHLLNSFSFLYSFPHFPQSPVPSPCCCRARCAVPRGVHGRWSTFLGPPRRDIQPPSQQRGLSERWAAAPRLRATALTSRRPSRLQLRSGCAPWLLPHHLQSSPHAGGLHQGFATRWL